VGITLRYPYEVRQPKDYFEAIENEKVPKDMLELDRARSYITHS
jgi:DNA end-binding protein Ku